MTNKKAAGIALLVVIIPAAYFIYQHLSISWLDAHTAAPSINTSSLSGTNQTAPVKTMVCPMHPEIMQDHPGACPICGMDLVESKNSSAHDHSIHVDSASVQKLGVRLTSVKKSVVSREVRGYGNVTADGSSVYNVHSQFDGWIKKVYIHSIGQRIAQGQVIYEIYSPDLIAQQKEYFRFLEKRNQILKTIGDVRFQENEYVMNLLTELSRERSKFIHGNVSPESLQRLEDSRMVLEVVKIVAEQSGVVTQIGAREGSYVMPAATLFTLANVSRVWVDVALYPDQVAQVKAGDPVTIKTPDGQKIESRIGLLSPIAENNKVSARVSIENGRLQLRPGSFVDAIIHAQTHEALVLPRSSVISTEQGDMVIMSRGEGHFLPVYIETGIESGDNIEIADGLLEGAEVAVNGQFLLDSAASMSAAAERFKSGGGQPGQMPGKHDAH